MAIDKNAVIKEAQKFTAKNQYAKALAEWKKLVKEYPNDANIFNTIGDLSLKNNAKSDAVDAYKKAADILSSDGFTSKAIALYKKILNIDPNKVEVHLALADLNAEKGLTGNALESYKIVADHYGKKNEMAKALNIYQKMADLNPSNVNFRLKLADMYVKEGLKKEAAKAYLEASSVYVSQNAFQDARQVFEKVLGLDPGNKEVYFKAGIVYHKEGKFAEACKAFKPAFESDPKNQELVDLYLDALSKAEKNSEVEEVLNKLLSQDPARVDLHEKLYGMYLARQDYDKALGEASAIVSSKVDEHEHDSAVEILKEFISKIPSHVAGRQKLSELYISIGREQDAAQEMIQIAELLATSGDREGAKDVLVRAAEIAPEMPDIKERLERLQAPPEAPPAQEPPASPPDQTSPSGDIFGAPPVSSPAIAEDPVIEESLTEIDVLIKYGLAGKAIEQLEGLAGKFSDNLRVRKKLRDIYREQGNVKNAVTHSLLLADLYVQWGMKEQEEEVLRDALSLDPENAVILARLGLAAAPAEETPSADMPLAEIPGMDWEGSLQSGNAVPEAAAPTPVSEAPEFQAQPPAPEAAGERLAESLSDTREDLIIQTGGQSLPVQEPLTAGVDISEIWAEAEFYYQQGLFDEARKHYERIRELAPDNARALERIAEISREKEDVQEFSKLAEAVEGLESFIPSGAPDQPDAAPSSSDEEAVQALMKEISELKKEKEKPSPPPAKKAAPPGKETEPKEEELFQFGDSVPEDHRDQARPGAEDELFDLGAELRSFSESTPVPPSAQESGDEFFDLAAELRDELGSVSFPKKQTDDSEDQSLDDIFEEFKKGVAEQAGKEDSDTHYNLGIAYKEMGLLDEAITEFLLTREGDQRFIESRYMLGLCYMEKSDYYKAIAEIGNALNYSESLSGEDDQRISMRYDLALAYQGAGKIDDAMTELQAVADLDPGYRDTASKLKELQQGDFISLDQLKEDIEKEISSKFFEEGERIEREEKTKKSEKMKT